MWRKILTAFLAIIVAAVIAGAVPATAGRPRPSDVPEGAVVTETAPNGLTLYNDYATPEQTFSSRRAVVHYVTVGIDAPPLNDDDGDGVPDYVERVGEAADTAIAYYERRQFARIPPDIGGPDSRPDLYVSRFAPGVMGVALPSCKAEGGAFAVVANNLDPSDTHSFASVYGTVAHELFHLVQFAYVATDADPPLPGWVLEGAAVAMESSVHPQLADLVSTLQLRPWLAAPQRSITSQTYAASLLWRYLDRRSPALIDAHLRRLAAAPEAGPGMVLVSTYERLTGARFADAFADFAVRTAGDQAEQLTPLATLARGDRRAGSVAPLAVHYLRLAVPRRGSHTVTVDLPAGGSALRAALAYRLEAENPGDPGTSGRILPRISNGGRTRTFTIPQRLRRSERLAQPTLVVSNAAARQALAYSVSIR